MPQEYRNIDEVIKIAKLCAKIILENGGETYRAEETVYRVCTGLGFKETDVFAIPTGVFITISKDGVSTSTTLKRIRKRGANLQAIETVNSVARQLTAGNVTTGHALEILRALPEEKAGENNLYVAAAGFASGFSALLFKGSIADFIAAAICGMIVQLVARYIKTVDMYNFAISIFGGFIIGVCSVAFVKLTGRGDLEKIITGAIMPLLPGIPMTNAIRDTMRGDLLSGVSRAAEALLIAVALAFGAGVVLKLYFKFMV